MVEREKVSVERLLVLLARRSRDGNFGCRAEARKVSRGGFGRLPNSECRVSFLDLSLPTSTNMNSRSSITGDCEIQSSFSISVLNESHYVLKST